MEIQIKMVSAASEVFNYKKKNPTAIHEEVFQHISNHLAEQRIRDQKIKLAMIAAAGRAFEIASKNPDASEKELLRQFVEQIPSVLSAMND
ncbi:MAG: hypothetical protein WC979_06195 [Candidatus Pacearchaeota archaeon]|jgi:hypothetical protein